MTPVAVTLLTGFLGAGKTTLLSHLLQGSHGCRIAVIENEFADADIDRLIIGDRAGELENTLLDLLDSRLRGETEFDRLVIESTGMADPGPVIRTFFSHPRLAEEYCLDGVITLVDAVHAMQQLDRFHVARAQAGYADRLLLTKTDLVADSAELTERLQRINARAEIITVIQGNIDPGLLFDLQGFMLQEQSRPAPRTFRFLPAAADNVSSLTITLDFPVGLEAISEVMETLMLQHAGNLLRYKGMLWISDQPCRLLFQGVQRLYSAGWDRPWQQDETPVSLLVFIGTELPEQQLRRTFEALRPRQ